MLWAKQQRSSVLRTYIRATYERFWKRELDIEDVLIIEAVLHDAGASESGVKRRHRRVRNVRWTRGSRIL